MKPVDERFDITPAKPPPRLASGSMAMPPIRDAPSDDAVALVHDLRGPLSVMQLEVAMLDETLPLGLHEARHALARIGRNLAYLDNLLRDLLDLSALETARFELAVEPIELCGLVNEVVERTVSTRDRSRVDVVASGASVIRADRRRIERVVANFLMNALKYSPRTDRVCVRVDRNGARVRVAICDSGPGIPPDQLARIFERFRRAPGTAHHDGYGLGLYVSRAIVEAHGGTVAVDSVVGRGSCFSFELPLLDNPR